MSSDVPIGNSAFECDVRLTVIFRGFSHTTRNEARTAMLSDADDTQQTAHQYSCLYHLNFRHRASCFIGQAFRYSPAKAFYIFNQQIYFII